MGIDAALRNQTQVGQTFQQGARNLGPFSKQDKRLGVGQSVSQNINILNVIRPDGHVVFDQLCKARQGPKGIEPIV
jgi:hypothetical protein